ncbi:MAG TPA: TIGR00341 family protein [Vicinamibacterales bacterium]|nr:TIGR00341 family protein [Vicinamibacterales bacterium]
MALRLLELRIPTKDLEKVPALCEDFGFVDLWTSDTTQDMGLARILLDAGDTEKLSDRLVRELGSREGFRMVLLPVEATVPAVEKPAKEDAPAGTESNGRAAPRISRDELYEDLASASEVTTVYVVMVALSTVVAGVGLIRDDVAVIIGAMVIAPLLGPNMALSLACTLGHADLAKRSLKSIAVGVTTAAVLSVLLGILLQVDPASPEIAARTRPGMGDVILALAAGAAGSLAFTTGVPAIVVGVMVAVALLPPLTVAGLLAGAGYTAAAGGALVLVLTNVTCVNLAAVATFLVQKVRPRTWWEADRARRATRAAMVVWAVLLVVLMTLMALGQIGTSA